jgi:hypothetical protein
LRGDYERLRADALTGGAQGWRWGGSILARAGVAGWIRTWSLHAARHEGAIMNSIATMRAPALATPEPLGRSSGAPVGAAVGAAQQPGQAEAIVALLALMLRGLLNRASRAGANA